jgi:thiamine phosphate synthase YjbQ (UPF0047 family)
MGATVRGMRRACYKEGVDASKCATHFGRVFINDDESGLHQDYEVWLEKLAPHSPTEHGWHNRTGEVRPSQFSVASRTRAVRPAPNPR